MSLKAATRLPMLHMKTSILLAALVLLHQEVCVAQTLPATSRYQGVARSGDGTVVYIEDHEVTFRGDRIVRSVTRYRRPDGQPFALMDSDYSRSLERPTYFFRDDSRGYEEGLAYENGAYLIYFSEPGKPRRTRMLDQPGAYSCQGWHYFLLDNLERIESGNLSLRLILPGRLDTFGFEFVAAESSARILKVRLRAANPILRAFAPSLLLTYDKSTRQLLQYRGVSNIPDARGRSQEVEITYAY